MSWTVPVTSTELFNTFKFESMLKCFFGSEPQCLVHKNYANKILPEVFRDFNTFYLHYISNIKLNQQIVLSLIVLKVTNPNPLDWADFKIIR